MDVVFHCSPYGELCFIKPRASKHGVRYVYAARHPAFSLFFLNKKIEHFGNCMINWDRMKGSDDIYIHERIPGAFRAAYEGAKGSMYHLPKSLFSMLPNGWPEEMVSRRAVRPIKELPIENVAAEIMSLRTQEPIHLYLYPGRPPHVPEDDVDLIFSTLSAASVYGGQFLAPLGHFHPRLFQTALEILSDPPSIHRLDGSLQGFCAPQEIAALESRLKKSGCELLRFYRAASPQG